MLKSLSLVACLALAASPALAADDSKKPSDETKMVCKRIQAAGTGWRLGKRKECKTQAEWDADARAQRDEVDRNNRRNNSMSGGSI